MGVAVPARAVGAPEFDLHGLAGIRLVGADARDEAAVARQLGPTRAALRREPDIVVRFVDRLESSSIRYLGRDEAGFTEDAFLVLRGRHKAATRVAIPFHEIGSRVEIVCERGIPAVPFLIPIVNMTVLAGGALPLHASAFVHRGTGVVATGWAKGGKTEALLAFAAAGAEYVGDEWVYVAGDGSRVHGIPEPIRLWSWHVRQLPRGGELVGSAERARLRALEGVTGSLEGLRRARARAPRLARAASRLGALLEKQLYVDVEPEQLFGRLGTLTARFDRLFFLLSGEEPEITVEPTDPLDVARRIASSLEHERLDFAAAYLKFRFAFPELRSDLVERAPSLEREALERLLGDKPAYLVRHPYPFSLRGLFDAMSPYCRS